MLNAQSIGVLSSSGESEHKMCNESKIFVSNVSFLISSDSAELTKG
jgi:hypothetical protein